MATPILNSAAASALCSVLGQTQTEVQGTPFSYKYSQDLAGSSFAQCARTHQEVQPQGSKVLGGQVSFTIPKAGILAGAVVRLKVGKTAAHGVNNSLGALAISEISLVTNGRILFTQTAQSLLSLIANMPHASRKTLEDMLLLKSGNDGSLTMNSTTEGEFFIPCLFSCFESLEMMPNVNFLEPIQIVCRMASASDFCTSDVDSDTAASVTLTDITLMCSYIQLSAKHEQALIQADFSDSENLSKVAWDMVHEFSDGTLSAGSTSSISHVIQSHRCVNQLFFCLDSGRGDASNTVDNVGAGIELDRVVIESNGQIIADLPAKLLGSLQGESFDQYGYSDSSYYDRTSRADGTNYRYVYNFSLSKRTNRVFGVISTREMSNFKLTVYTANAGATQTAARLHVIMKSPMLISISPESGRITSSISS